MNYLKHFLLTVLVALLSSVSSFAYDFEVNGIYYNTISIQDLTCAVTFGDYKYSGVVVIPSSVSYSGRTFNVTTIGESSFSSCTGLKTVVIPKSVSTFEESAFRGCTGLSSVEIPNSVKTIGRYVFEGCI